MEMVSPAGAGEPTLDPALELLDQSGRKVAEEDNGLGNGSLIQYRLAATSSYRIIARAHSGAEAGTYQLRVTGG